MGWSLAAPLLGGLRGAARRVGIATDTELHLPPRATIADFQERKADRTLRGIEALWAELGAELGQQRPQKSESLEMFFATNKVQRRRCDRLGDQV